MIESERKILYKLVQELDDKINLLPEGQDSTTVTLNRTECSILQELISARLYQLSENA